MPAPLLVMAPRMPATRVPCQELLALVALGEQRVLHVRRRHPVARVGGIRVAPVTVVGGEKIALRIRADHVVAGQQAVGGGTAQVRVVKAHAGIELGDHDAVAAGRQVPGFHGVDRRRLRVLQVPLPGEQRIIGQRLRVAALVLLGVLHLRVRAQACQRLRGARSLNAQQLDAGDDVACIEHPATRRGSQRCSAPRPWRAFSPGSAPPGRSRAGAACCATAETGSSATRSTPRPREGKPKKRIRNDTASAPAAARI